jgi:signal transduction histidine kinase/ActR/RegA family two-component response regulator
VACYGAAVSNDVDAVQRIRGLEDRLRIISSSLRAFAEATTDYERLLDVVARKLSEVVQDGCVVRLLNEDGWLLPVAVHLPIEGRIRDAATLERLRAHVARPQRAAAQLSAQRVLETGEALIIPKLDYAALRKTTHAEIVNAYETLGIHSALLIALRAQGQSIGLLALVRFEPDAPPFNDADRELAQTLADNAAMAVSNAKTFQSMLRELAERERAEAALRKTEEQLRHAQKMEAIGRLAGSVAHDFNNLLSVILGQGALIHSELRQGDPMREEVASIIGAGERAADLTQQLLAFSRQQVLVPRVLDLNASVRDSMKILQRLLGEDIELVTRLDRNLSKVKADPGQIDQVIMNLSINARHAMPDGGKLTIETHDVVLEEAYTSEHVDIDPGPYVLLAVSDTGIGMTKETQARIFEPFFTTKGVGKGSGLGLSTVFGIVKQSGGNVWVYSEPGQGATFKIYLPRCDEPSVAPAAIATKAASYNGTETILLVEDQDDVRRVAIHILRRYGYHVVEARNAGEALLSCEQHATTIHLLLTDVVMPQMNGRKLADRLLKIRPELKVLFMSGYAENAIVHHGILDSGIAFLQKPLLPEALARRVREVLDSPQRVLPSTE